SAPPERGATAERRARPERGRTAERSATPERRPRSDRRAGERRAARHWTRRLAPVLVLTLVLPPAPALAGVTTPAATAGQGGTPLTPAVREEARHRFRSAER